MACKQTSRDSESKLGVKAVRAGAIRETDESQSQSGKGGQHGNAERICGKGIKQKSAHQREQRHGRNAHGQTGVNHQRREQINLRPEQIAEQVEW